MTRTNEGGIYPTQSTQAATMRSLLCTLEALERENTETKNAHLRFVCFCIILLPAFIVILLFFSSHNLRQANLRYVVLDVVIGSCLLMVFQATFYFFGKNWEFTSMEKVHRIVGEKYRQDAENDGDSISADENFSVALGLHNSHTITGSE
jgi:hypothetical protein